MTASCLCRMGPFEELRRVGVGFQSNTAKTVAITGIKAYCRVACKPSAPLLAVPACCGAALAAAAPAFVVPVRALATHSALLSCIDINVPPGLATALPFEQKAVNVVFACRSFNFASLSCSPAFKWST
jgi:hypothetical protein